MMDTRHYSLFFECLGTRLDDSIHIRKIAKYTSFVKDIVSQWLLHEQRWALPKILFANIFTVFSLLRVLCINSACHMIQ